MNGDPRALRTTIEEFRARTVLDKSAAAVLKRLGADEWKSHVSAAFAIVPPERWAILITDCIYAEREMRAHKRIVEHSKAVLARVPEAEESLKMITKFVKVVRDGSNVTGHDPIPEALATFRNEIFYARRDAMRSLKQHSQKTERAAGRAIGIGWLKASLQSYAPQARNFRKLVAELAEAVLNAGPVTEDAVRHAATPRERLDRAYEIKEFARRDAPASEAGKSSGAFPAKKS